MYIKKLGNGYKFYKDGGEISHAQAIQHFNPVSDVAEFYDIKKKKHEYGGELYDDMKSGGGIHIKKANRGKFTESANRAGMGVQEYAKHILANKDNYSSKLVKRANFARNASKWNKAEGGQLNAQIPNENAIQLDDNVQLALNDNGGVSGTHEQGDNIPVYKNGQQSANVEPGEVVITLPDGSSYALSKRLGFAQQYMELDNKKKELRQAEGESTDLYAKNTLKRELDAIDAQIMQLPKLQRDTKVRLGISDVNDKEAAYGKKLSYQDGGELDLDDEQSQRDILDRLGYNKAVGAKDIFGGGKAETNEITPEGFNWEKIGKGATELLPLVDNIVNAYLIKNTPEIPKPELYKPVNLETDYNINASLYDINRNIAGSKRMIDENTASSNSALRRKMGMDVAGIGARSNLYQQKGNIERELRNRNLINAQNISNENLGLINKYNMDVVARKAGMQQDTSKNVANLSDDITNYLTRMDKKDYQNKQLELQSSIYEDSASFRNTLSTFGNDTSHEVLQDIYDKLEKGYDEGKGEDWNKKMKYVEELYPNVKKGNYKNRG